MPQPSVMTVAFLAEHTIGRNYVFMWSWHLHDTAGIRSWDAMGKHECVMCGRGRAGRKGRHRRTIVDISAHGGAQKIAPAFPGLLRFLISFPCLFPYPGTCAWSLFLFPPCPFSWCVRIHSRLRYSAAMLLLGPLPVNKHEKVLPYF